jgi:hypothetical protein
MTPHAVLTARTVAGYKLDYAAGWAAEASLNQFAPSFFTSHSKSDSMPPMSLFFI